MVAGQSAPDLVPDDALSLGYDLYYAKHQSPSFDIEIVLRTLFRVREWAKARRRCPEKRQCGPQPRREPAEARQCWAQARREPAEARRCQAEARQCRAKARYCQAATRQCRPETR